MWTRLALTVSILAAGASVHGQSLGEAAAREKERRAKMAGSGKTFTDSDLEEAASKRARENPASTESPAPSPGPSASPSAPSGRPRAARPQPEASASADESAAEARKARGAELKAQLDAASAELARAEEELALADKYWRMANDHRLAMAPQYDQLQERFEAATRKVERLRHQKLEIEETARRESIPPGYLR